MAKLNAVVFSASIENEHAIRLWIESVQDQADVARQALDDLGRLLDSRPHIAITLTQSARSGGGRRSSVGAGEDER